MKFLTAFLLMLSLVLPVGALTQVGLEPTPVICTVVGADGSSCCEPAAIHCCCSASDETPAPAPLPNPPASSQIRDLAAALPALLLLTELPRLSETSVPTVPDNDHAADRTLPSTRACVLRCSLLL